MEEAIRRADRVGEVSVNKYGSKMTITRYDNNKNIDVMFENGLVLTNRVYRDFVQGKIKSPYCKTVFGEGYLGVGEQELYDDNISTRAYTCWQGMMERCYSARHKEKHPTYQHATVAEEWHNFQTFAIWYNKNYYEIDEKRSHLDKDILTKGNKMYSPHTCVFTPSHINMMFVKNDATRGSSPIGVTYCNSRGKYVASCNDICGKRKHLGRFDNEANAFIAYKHKKEEVIKQVADKYKNDIPEKLYDAMYNYKVEITD